MPNYNKVILLGNLTRDPELRQTQNSTSVVTFGMAVNRKWKGSSGEDRNEVVFVDCEAFGRQADVIYKYCRKGNPLLVDGRLRMDQWTVKATGEKATKLLVAVDTFQLLGGKPESEE